MLELEDRPIEEIAFKVGYSDLASFRRLFRKIAGSTQGSIVGAFGCLATLRRQSALHQPRRNLPENGQPTQSDCRAATSPISQSIGSLRGRNSQARVPLTRSK